MKVRLNDKTAVVDVFHYTPEEYVKSGHYGNVTIRDKRITDCLDDIKDNISNDTSNFVKPRMLTVALVSLDGKTSTGLAICHENDTFNKRSGTSRALAKALKGHEAFAANKELRTTLYRNMSMFNPTPSPYAELMNLVKTKPDLAKQLTEYGRKISTGDQ